MNEIKPQWKVEFDKEFDAPFQQWTPLAVKAFIKDQITKAQQEISEQILQDIRFEATEFIKDQLRNKYLNN